MFVSKGKLKAKMLDYFREVERTGEPLIVTDNGREVLEIRSVGKQRKTTDEVLALYRSGPGSGILPSAEDLMKPLPEEDWEVLSENKQIPW